MSGKPNQPHDPQQHDPLDSWLDSALDAEPSAQLLRAIAEVPVRHPRVTAAPVWWPFGSLWKSATMGLAVCVLGVVAGMSDIDASISDSATNEIVETAASDTLTTDYADLAFAISLDQELAP